MYKSQIWSIKSVIEKAKLPVVSWAIGSDYDYGQVIKVSVELTHEPFKIDEAYVTGMPIEKTKTAIAAKIAHYLYNIYTLHIKYFGSVSKMHLGIWTETKKNGAYIINTIEVTPDIETPNIYFILVEFLSGTLDSSIYEKTYNALPVLILIEKSK